MKKAPLLAALLLAGLPATSLAVVTVTHTYEKHAYNAGADFTVNTSDLINNGMPSAGAVSSTYTPLGIYGGITVLTDGIASGNDTLRTLPSNLQTFTVTYELNTVTNVNGYTITNINSFAGNSDGRARQEYQVFYRLVGETTFTQLIPDNYTTDRPSMPFQTNTSTTPGAVDGGGGGETALYINIGGLEHVDAVRFVTSVASGNSTGSGATVYREFDVIGSASVPEASVAGLLGAVSVLGLVRRRR